ncbi:MAG: aminofutalosine synthase MqnE [Bacteroidetes bacterium]|nr:aminofutalosine synthase MqnE [Bacteroidota bacterium]
MIELNKGIGTILNNPRLDTKLKSIGDKVMNEERISVDEGIYLFENASLGFVGSLANWIREKRFGDTTFFNRNFHVEPTNLCVFTCNFCSYSRKLKQREDGWVMTKDEILDIVKGYKDKPVTEVHIVGGVLPEMNLEFFLDVIRQIKKIKPGIHVKAFTAVELEYMIRKAKLTYKEGLLKLKEAGMDSLPGGGAEIFDETLRAEICGDKCTTDQWLEMHRLAHEIGLPSNATILYGHIETYAHRVDHMDRLRTLQDETGGFNTYIPLKFRNVDNEMSHIPEGSVVEDLKNYAISRIFLDNFDHIKTYWPMIGRTTAQLSLNYGVDDVDGTIDDSTKIYSMAGSEEQKPVLTTRELVDLIEKGGREAVERDTIYNVIRNYSKERLEEVTE